MKAAILTELNKPLIVDNVELTELQIGQVLIKVIVSGICGAQLQEIRGEKNNAKYLPHLLGHEGCGLVQALGPGVTKVKVGDKVIMHWRKGDGIESELPKYIYKGKIIGGGRVTTLSEYSVVSENRITSVSHDTPDELCVLLGCSLSTALGVINNDAKLKFGETLLVLGCGGVGINIIKNSIKTCRVYGADMFEDKRKIVEETGATFYNSQANQELNMLTLLKPDCIIDTTGSTELLSIVLPTLSEQGRLILLTPPKEGSCITFYNPISFFAGDGLTIKSTQGGKTIPQRDLKRYIQAAKEGAIDIKNIITHRFKLDDINTAIDLVRSGKAGRIIIEM